MITMSGRVLAAAAALALLTSCSTSETSADADAAKSDGALPTCDQIAAVLADRVLSYTFNPADSKTEPDDIRCIWDKGGRAMDDISVAFFRTSDGPEGYVGWEERPAEDRLPGLELVEDPLLDGREGHLTRLGEAPFRLTQWRAPSYWMNIIVQGRAQDEVTVAEVVSLLDLIEG